MRAPRAAKFIVGVSVCVSAFVSACSGRERPGVLTDWDAGDKLDTGSYRPRDAVPIRNPDVSCGGTSMTLTRRRATAILLIDRSGSMNQQTTDGQVKWSALLDALRGVLPRVENTVAMGLGMFPLPAARDAPNVPATACSVPARLAIEPGYRTANSILETLRADYPLGATPTAAALELARRWYQSAPDLNSERYVILATDGAPNCNADVQWQGCRCTSPTPAVCSDGTVWAPINCLDGDRTVAAVSALRAMGIITIVIGLNGVQDYGDVLDAMASAGGQPRPMPPRYYSAATAPELAQGFAEVTSSIVECRFQLDHAPPDPNLVDVRLDGRSLVFDTSQRDGWNWSGDGYREIRFFGPTCESVRWATGGSQLVAAFGCPAPVPP